LSVRVVIDVLCNFFVDRISFHRDVNSYARFQIDDVILECLNFSLKVFVVLLHHL
jgi:hypothetical protein